MNLRRPFIAAARRAQRGVTTVLLALLVGLSLAALAFGLAYHLRGAQEQGMTLHSQTQAQMKAWTGAEVVRQFLSQLTSTQLTTLVTTVQAGSGTALTLSGLSGVTATLMPASTTSLIVAQITGSTASGTRAASNSKLLVQYAVSGGSSSGSTLPSVVTFNRNLKLGGSITVKTNGTSTYQINVLGDVSTNGNSITGVNTINSTGTINIDSGSSYTVLRANCDVVLSGSVTAVTVSARRHICTSGAAAVSGTATANGSITAAAAYGSNGTLASVANATDVSSCAATGTSYSSSSSSATPCATPSVSGVDLSAGNAGATAVTTAGNVTLSSGKIGTLTAAGNLTVSSSGTVSSGTIGGTLTKPSWNGNVNVTVNSGQTVSVSSAPTVSVTTTTVNAYDYEGVANYAFKVDSSGYRKVTVRNVNGIADGTYYLGNYSGAYYDYLCTALVSGTSTTSPTCKTPTSPSSTATICKGYSAYNSCISYSSGTWTIAGTTLAPGVTWFEGNLVASNGTYYNTFIATGNITTSGSHVDYAPNYAGYSGTVSGVTYAPTGICVNSYFSSLYPTQLCDITNTAYLSSGSSGVGNYAYLAGSYSTSDGTTYVGGNITLGSSTVAYGSVYAGNQFSSGGSTTVHGYITALGLGSSTSNSMGGSTTIDLSSLPSTFSPGGTSSTSVTATLKFARYQ